MNKIFTVSIIGCGSRGGFCYGQAMYAQPNRYKIVSLCDIDRSKLSFYGDKFGVEEKGRFLSEEHFFEKKRSDALVIATQDRDHVRMCIKALALGYDVLLEKPVSPDKEELLALLDAQRKYGGKVVVCHVLRYAPAFTEIKRLLDSGEFGKLIRIESIEQVSFWHQAHSYIRGNWRREEDTSPMIMAKCCHDLDLLQYYAGARCDTVYSVGDLAYFKPENKPEDAAERCAECKYIDTCPYSAKFCYITRWEAFGKPESRWPFNVITNQTPLTEESLRTAYENGDYGRCVFACDNDVVDNQSVSIKFENGIKADHVMTAFTNGNGRRMTFHCTHGEIRLMEDADVLEATVYTHQTKTYSLSELAKDSVNDSFGHGGGDVRLIDDFYKILCGNQEAGTSLEKSVESHLIALAAEESRKSGKPVKVHK